MPATPHSHSWLGSLLMGALAFLVGWLLTSGLLAFWMPDPFRPLENLPHMENPDDDPFLREPGAETEAKLAEARARYAQYEAMSYVAWEKYQEARGRHELICQLGGVLVGALVAWRTVVAWRGTPAARFELSFRSALACHVGALGFALTTMSRVDYFAARRPFNDLTLAEMALVCLALVTCGVVLSLAALVAERSIPLRRPR